MAGIQFDYTINDSAFYSSSDRIVKRVKDMSAVIENIGKSVDLAPLVRNFDSITKSLELEGTKAEEVRGKLVSSLEAIANSSDSAATKQEKFLNAINKAFEGIGVAVDEKINGARETLKALQDDIEQSMRKAETLQKRVDKANDPEFMNNLPQSNKARYLNAQSEMDAVKEGIATSRELMNAFDELLGKLMESREAIDENRKALSELRGETGNLSDSVPQLFSSEAEYRHVREMRKSVEELQAQIANFEGSDKELQELRERLSETKDELREAEDKAIKAAAALGSDLGTRASEASEHLYEINATIKEQTEVVAKLTEEYNKAAEAYNAVSESDDIEAREKALRTYDELAQKLQNAEVELTNMKVEQKDANSVWIETSAEIDRHNSVLVKMLGGEEKFQSIVAHLPEPLRGAAEGITGMTGAAKAFIATPLGAVLAALIIAWETLTQWFERSEEGQLALAKITGYFSGILETLKDVVATVGEAIYKTFTNPLQALKNFGNFLVSQVVNRFKALGDMMGAVGTIMSRLFSGDWGGVLQGVRDLANAWAQLGTGIEKPIDKAIDAIDKLNKKATESANISRDKKQLERQEAQTKRLVAGLESRQRQLEAKGKRRTAAEEKELKTIDDKITKANLAIINKKIELQERSMSNGKYDTIEDKNKLDELYAERERITGKGLVKEERLRNQAFNRMKKSSASHAKQETENLEAENAKKISNELRYQEQLQKLRKQMDDAFSDLDVASIRDSGERERAEREAQHNKTLADIKAQEQDIYKAIYEQRKKTYESENKGKNYENTKAGAAGWGADAMSGTLSEKEQEYFDVRMNILQANLTKENVEYERYQEELARNLISQHQSYIDKKIQIDEDYANTVKQIDDSIAKAEARGDASTVEALKRTKDQAAVDHAKQQAQLSLEELKESPEYIRAFEDLDNVSADTLNHLIQRFEETKEAAAENLTPTELKEYADTIQRMHDELASRDPFKALTDSLKKVNTAEKNVKAAKERLKLIQDNKKVVKGMREENGKLVKTYWTQKEAEESLREAEDKYNKEIVIHNKNQKEAGDVVNELASNIEYLGEAMGGAAGEILGLVGNVMTFAVQCLNAVNFLIQATKNTAQGATAAIKAVESASVILAVIGAALQIMTKLTSLFGANYDEYNKLKARFDALSEVWDDLINKKREYLGESWGEEARNVVEETKRLIGLEREMNKLTALARLESGASAGSHSIGYRIWNKYRDEMGRSWGDVNQTIARQLGVQFNNAADLLDMNAEQLQWIKENYTGLWVALDDDFRQALENIIKYAQTEADLLVSLKEQITGQAFDSLFDDFMSALYDLANGSEEVFDEVADNWQQMMNEMLINNVIGNRLRDQLEDWYNRWYDAYANNNDLSSAELESLRREYDNLFKNAASQVETLRAQGLIAATEEAEAEAAEYFSDLRSMWLDTLMDMEGDASDFEKEIARVMTEDLINSLVLNKDFEKWLDDWKEKYATAIAEGNTDAMNALLQEQKDMREKLAEEAGKIAGATGYAELMKNTEEELEEEAEDAFESLHDSFLDALMDMNADAETWAKNIGQTIARQLVEEKLLGEAFGTVLDQWKSDVNEIISVGSLTDPETIAAISSKTAEMKDLLSGMAPQVKEFLTALGLVDDEVSKINTSFKNMRSTIVSSFTNLNATSEDFAKSLSRTMIEEMVDTIVDSRYQTRMDEIMKQWQTALLNGDTSAMEAIKNDIIALRKEAESDETVKGLIDNLKKVEQEVVDVATSFDNLRSTVKSSLLDLNATSEDFFKSISRTMTDEMVNQIVQSRFQKQLDDIKEKWKEALLANDTTAMDTLRAQLVALRDSAKNAVQPLLDDLAELERESTTTPFDNLRESFISTLMNMEETAEDFSDNLAQIISKALIDQFVLGNAFDKKLEEWKERYAEIMDNDNLTDEQRTKYLNDLKDSITEAREDYTQRAREIQEMMGITSASAKEDQQASLNMADKATYDQFELFLGIAMAQQIAIEQGNAVRQQILSTLQTTSGITSPNGDTVREIRSILRTTNEHLYAIKLATEGIRIEFMPRLQSIDNKLSRL